MFCTFTFDRGLRFGSGLLLLKFTAAVGVFTWAYLKKTVVFGWPKTRFLNVFDGLGALGRVGSRWARLEGPGAIWISTLGPRRGARGAPFPAAAGKSDGKTKGYPRSFQTWFFGIRQVPTGFLEA